MSVGRFKHMSDIYVTDRNEDKLMRRIPPLSSTRFSPEILANLMRRFSFKVIVSLKNKEPFYTVQSYATETKLDRYLLKCRKLANK
jgi:hypothetical protein